MSSGYSVFGMFNFTSNWVKEFNMSCAAEVLQGNGGKVNMLTAGFELAPEAALIRFNQERGRMLNLRRVKIPIPEVG